MKALSSGEMERYKHSFKASLKDFDGGNQSGVVLLIKERLIMKKCESVKLKESAENHGVRTNFLTWTWSTSNRQFRARIDLVSQQRTPQHTCTSKIQEIKIMVIPKTEGRTTITLETKMGNYH